MWVVWSASVVLLTSNRLRLVFLLLPNPAKSEQADLQAPHEATVPLSVQLLTTFPQDCSLLVAPKAVSKINVHCVQFPEAGLVALLFLTATTYPRQ